MRRKTVKHDSTMDGGTSTESENTGIKNYKCKSATVNVKVVNFGLAMLCLICLCNVPIGNVHYAVW